MSGWGIQLLIASLGLAAAAVLASALLWIWRARPVAAYRLAVLVLIAALVLPLGQLVVGSLWRPGATPLGEAVLAWREEARSSCLGALERWGAKRDVAEPGRTPAFPAADRPAEPADEERPDATLLGRHGGSARVARVARAEGADPDPRRLHPDPLARGALESPRSAPRTAPVRPEWSQPVRSATVPASAPEAAVSLRESLGGILTGLAWIYVLGCLLALSRSGLRLLRARRLLREARPPSDPRVSRAWRALAGSSRVARRVRLLESPRIRAPMCSGLLRPAILVPATLAPTLVQGAPRLDREMLTCVLLHELCHLERRDSWVMLAQELLRAFFWFHPAAWWLCHRIDLLREVSCDVLVVERTGRRKRYARALLEYATWIGRELGRGAKPTALLSWTSSRSQLTRRIEMLVENRSRTHRRPRTTFLAACSVFLCLWAGQLGFAAVVSPSSDESVSGQEARPPAPDLLPEPAPLPTLEPPAPVAPWAPVAPIAPGAPEPVEPLAPSFPAEPALPTPPLAFAVPPLPRQGASVRGVPGPGPAAVGGGPLGPPASSGPGPLGPGGPGAGPSGPFGSPGAGPGVVWGGQTTWRTRSESTEEIARARRILEGILERDPSDDAVRRALGALQAAEELRAGEGARARWREADRARADYQRARSLYGSVRTPGGGPPRPDGSETFWRSLPEDDGALEGPHGWLERRDDATDAYEDARDRADRIDRLREELDRLKAERDALRNRLDDRIRDLEDRLDASRVRRSYDFRGAAGDAAGGTLLPGQAR